MAAVCTELPFFGSIQFYRLIASATVVQLEAKEHYQKGGYRNRCLLAGPNGLLRLSIPLQKGKHQSLPIQEVKLAYTENWPLNSWRSIQTAYGNAPFFIHYADDIREVLLAGHERLWDLNIAALRTSFRLLRWKAQPQVTETTIYQHKTEGAADWRNLITPKMPHDDTPSYPQVFTEKHGFIPDLSILDLLFCLGPAASDYLIRHRIDWGGDFPEETYATGM